jgi:hypothetical protein
VRVQVLVLCVVTDGSGREACEQEVQQAGKLDMSSKLCLVCMLTECHHVRW